MIVFLLANRKLHGNDENHLILTARFAVLTTMLCVTSFHFFHFKLTANIFNVEILRIECDSLRYKNRVQCIIFGSVSGVGMAFQVTLESFHLLLHWQKCLQRNAHTLFRSSGMQNTQSKYA